jgi:protoporphyrinogen oxidase
MGRTAIIIGAGPAGLTAAYELVHRTDIRPVVLEAGDAVGGISKTVTYKGNRIDLGGHRFFTKSDRVRSWWLNLLPLERQPGSPGADPDQEDRVMLVRKRVSRIYFLRRFFDYPITLTPGTLRKLGFVKAVRIGLSYLRSMVLPLRDVQNIEQLMINRFGRELYNTFFKSYTEKLWGVACDQISADWGIQRIKDLSVARAVTHAVAKHFKRSRDIEQKDTATSLIEYFMYPKYGPGQMWETAAQAIREKGGEIHLHHRVTRLITAGRRIAGVVVEDTSTGARREIRGEHFFSTMPVKDLVAALDCPAPGDARRVAEGLQYRDFIGVGLLVRKLRIKNDTGIPTPNDVIPDTWIYIQEPEVKLGRMQIFNNWSRYMVRDPDNTLWLGLEYFCSEGDDLWRKPDAEFLTFAVDELARIEIIDKADMIDGVVLRVKKTYPAYVGTYDQFDVVRKWLDGFENLFLIGRNGMHRYNNQDHSMLTAMVAVDNLVNGFPGKENIWAVNTEQIYHETSS